MKKSPDSTRLTGQALVPVRANSSLPDQPNVLAASLFSWSVKKTVFAAVAVVVIAMGPVAQAATYTYSSGSNGDWSDSGIWSPVGGPPGATDTAVFSGDIGKTTPQITLTGDTTIANLFGDAGNGTKNITGGALTFTITSALNVNDTTTMAIRGQGMSFSGNSINVNAGTLNFGNSGGSNNLRIGTVTISGSTVVASEAVLRFNVVATSDNRAQLASLENNGTLSIYTSTADSLVGGATVTSLSGSGTTQAIKDAISTAGNSAILTINGGNGADYSGLIRNSETGTSQILSLIKSGVGTQTLSGSGNSYTGSTTISGGTLSVSSLADGGSNSSIGASSSADSNLVFDGGTLQFTGASATSDRAFTIIDGKTAMIDTANNISLAGATGAASTGALTKTGTGALTLTGTSTYTGETTISAGTLILGSNGSIASSSAVDLGTVGKLDVSAVSGFALASGQTLKGSGTVTGAITLASGATLAIGNSPGTMTFDNDLTLSSGSISDFEIDGFTSGFYDLANTGAGSQEVTFDGTLNLIFQGGFNTVGTVKIFDFETYADDFAAVNTSGLAGGFTATFNELTGVVSVVPEPSTIAMLLFGSATCLTLTRRRRSRNQS